MLRAEEANLLHALYLARTYHLSDNTLGCAQGLRPLYELAGRTTEWARLVTDIQTDFLDPVTDQPRPGHEEHYSVIAEYRAWIARNRRDWPTATHLHTTRTAWDRDRALPYLDLPADQLDARGRQLLRTLAVSEHQLGHLLAAQDYPTCRDHYQAAHDLLTSLGDTHAQATVAMSSATPTSR